MKYRIIRSVLISTMLVIQSGCISHSYISERSDHNLCYQGFYGESPKSDIQILNCSVMKLVNNYFPSSNIENDKRWIKSHTCRATFELVVPDEWVEMRIQNLELVPCESKYQDEYEIHDPFPDWYGPNQSSDYQIFSSKILQTSTFPVCELLIDTSTLNDEYRHIFIHYDQWPM